MHDHTGKGPEDWAEQNRRSWNNATAAHNRRKRDQAGFLKSGGSTLFPEECELLGALDGLRLLHLQCNAGQDTLSLARLGAEATGVDISDEAIDFAARLSTETGIAACFERADVYAWLDDAAEQGRRFERVFASYGALPWLYDLARWVRGAARLLEPGGKLVLVEFHPAGMMFDEQWQPTYPYASDGKPRLDSDGVGDYVAASGTGLAPSGLTEPADGFSNEEACVEFSWGIGDVIGAVLKAGLRLETFREYPYANGCSCWKGARMQGRRVYPPAGMSNVPLMYGVVAARPATD